MSVPQQRAAHAARGRRVIGEDDCHTLLTRHADSAQRGGARERVEVQHVGAYLVQDAADRGRGRRVAFAIEILDTAGRCHREAEHRRAIVDVAARA